MPYQPGANGKEEGHQHGYFKVPRERGQDASPLGTKFLREGRLRMRGRGSRDEGEGRWERERRKNERVRVDGRGRWGEGKWKKEDGRWRGGREG